MGEITLDAIFSKIDECNEIFELYENDLIPPNNYGDEYYFISYSHNDFRFVYKDIFSLQKKKIQIWFDRGMTPGRDWDETAEHFIANFACKGVIIYLGEKSFSSKAVLKEIRLALLYKKPLIPFVINPKGLINNDIAETFFSKMELGEKDKELLRQSFNESTFYIDASCPIEAKVNYIENLRDTRPVVEVVEFNDENHLDMVPNIGRKEGKIAINLNNRQLHEVKLDEDIDFIYKVAFANSDNIHSLDLRHVVSIDDYAFSNCDKLFDLTLGQLEYLGVSCFEGCSNLKKVTFIHNPNKEKEDLEALMKAFDEIKLDEGITDEELSEAINELSIENGAEEYELYDQEHFPEREFRIGGNDNRADRLENSRRLFAYCTSLETFDVPLNLFDIIPSECFLGCSSLKQVKASNISKIKEGAFRDCENLLEFDYADADIDYEVAQKYLSRQVDPLSFTRYLTLIEKEAFYRCRNLQFFLFPLTLVALGDYAFAKSGLVYAYLYSLKEMSVGVFEGCLNLKEVELNCFNLKEVPAFSFRACKALKRAVLSERIASIGESAFMGDLALESFPSGLTNLSKIEKNAFRKCGLKEVELASFSIEIHSGAFANNHNLTKFILPKFMDRLYLDKDVFFDCPNLKDIVVPEGLVATLDFGAFDKTVENVFYQGSEEKYRQYNWIKFSIVDRGCVDHYYGERYDEIPDDREDYLKENRERLNIELEKRLRFYSKTPIKDGKHWHYNDNGDIEIYR
ncbi:MAG: leucine-rich repeat protein [Bacilli bacterium]|nr:leucine-rich repeat protein [Bacilli bacterium]